MDVLLDVGGRCGVRCFVLVWLLVVKVSANCPPPQGNNTLALTSDVLSKTYVPRVTYDIFKCAPGHFTKSGTGSVTCQDDNTWSETTLQCEIITCEIPPAVTHRSHSWVSLDKPKHGEKITFSCDSGYTLIGQKINLCGDGGKYDAKPPDCVDMNCEIPPAVANGRSTWVSKNEPSNGEIITFSCNKGYTLIGASRITCMIGGQYDSPPPVCKDMNCDIPRAVANGRSSWVSKNEPSIGAVIRFFCNKGYTLIGASSITCKTGGQYDSPPPVCTDMNCDIPPAVANRKSSWVSQDEPSNGEMIRFSCNKGFTLIGASSITCKIGGQYDSPPPVCKDMNCDIPPASANRKSSWVSKKEPSNGQIITFSCDSGYTLIGASSITCMVGGHYNSPLPECKDMSCDIPPAVANGRSSWVSKKEPSNGEMIRFFCNKGYTLIGASSITCKIGGQYDSPPPECKDMNCDIPPAVAHGRSSWVSKNEPSNGQIITFSCDSGYNLIGASSITCKIGGQYDSPPPECKDMKCDIPPALANGRSSIVFQDDPSIGEIIRFYCDDGYTLIGASSITCMVGGQYDSQLPVCKAKPTTDKDYVVITVKDLVLCGFAVAFVFLFFLYVCLYRKKSSVNGTAPLC